MSDTDFVTISSGALTARINPLGAELWSLRDAVGREYMTDGDPAFWTGHAPLLFPIVGGLRGGVYRVSGTQYALPRHGFARHSRFEIVDLQSHAVRFLLTDSADTRGVYPFPFALEMAFALDGATLLITARVTNTGDAVLPFSFGYHPAFAWPLPGGAAKADHVIAFAEPEPATIRRLDPQSGLVLPDPFPTPVEGHHLPLDSSLFEADAMIWDTLSSRSLTYGPPGAAQLAIAFPDTPMLGIWQKPGARFLCIEPWQGIADPADFTGELADKPGIVSLPPGDTHAMRMNVALVDAD